MDDSWKDGLEPDVGPRSPEEQAAIDRCLAAGLKVISQHRHRGLVARVPDLEAPLADAFPDLGIVLVGKHGRDGRTATALGAAGLSALPAHRSRPLDGFDLPLLEQLAIVEACDVFLARRVRAFAA